MSLAAFLQNNMKGAANNTVDKMVNAAPEGKKTIGPSQNTAAAKPQLKWVDPTMKSANELRAEGNQTLGMLLTAGQRQKQGQLGDQFLNKITKQDEAKTHAVFDPKAMGLPEGMRVTYADDLAGIGRGAVDKNKLRLTKNIGERKWVNYDLTKQANGGVKLSNPWVSQSTSFAQDMAKTLSIAAMLVPGLGQAVGSSLFGLGGTAAKIAGGALVQGGISAIGSGGDLNAILKGAAAGGLGGATQGIVNGLTGVGGMTAPVAGIVGKGLVGAGTAAITGGNPLLGAVLGNIPGVNTGMGMADRLLNYVIKDQIKQSVTKKPGG